jgi:hypothetical protein
MTTPPENSTPEPQDNFPEIDPDELFEHWAKQDVEGLMFEEEEESHSRFSVGRHPLLLVLVIALSGFMSLKTWPAMNALLNRDHFEQCGRVVDRAQPDQTAGEPGDKPQELPSVVVFRHQQQCELEGIVQHLNKHFSIGAKTDPEHPDRYEKLRGVSYVVKLVGDRVFALLPAHKKWVEGHRLREGSLFGLNFKARGLMIQPRQESSYQGLDRQIRIIFGIPLEEDIWFFDLTYSPWDRKMPLLTFVLSPIIGLSALIALILLILRRRSGAHLQE